MGREWASIEDGKRVQVPELLGPSFPCEDDANNTKGKINILHLLGTSMWQDLVSHHDNPSQPPQELDGVRGWLAAMW